MNNLTGLPVGTKVLIYDHNLGAIGARRAEIVAVTKGGNYKLSGSLDVWTTNGTVRGSASYLPAWFGLFDQEEWDRLEAENRECADRYRLRRASSDFNTMSIDVVRALLAVIDAAK
jgi:hypothetical protein